MFFLLTQFYIFSGICFAYESDFLHILNTNSPQLLTSLLIPLFSILILIFNDSKRNLAYIFFLWKSTCLNTSKYTGNATDNKIWNLFLHFRQSTPQVSYTRAIDIWLLVCLSIVSAVLLEFGIVIKCVIHCVYLFLRLIFFLVKEYQNHLFVLFLFWILNVWSPNCKFFFFFYRVI